jgi:hypothetical protein
LQRLGEAVAHWRRLCHTREGCDTLEKAGGSCETLEKVGGVCDTLEKAVIHWRRLGESVTH